MECALDFEGLEFLTPAPTQDEPEQVATEAPVLPLRRKYDPSLFTKCAKARTVLEEHLKTEIARRIADSPDAFQGLNVRFNVEARPKSAAGSHVVLKSLIEMILQPGGAAATQSACRAAVQVKYPNFAVYKDWTKELPRWAIEYAKKRVTCSGAPIASIVIKKGMALRDLHNASKAAMAKGRDGGAAFTAKIVITPDSVIINGVQFKQLKNKSNGKEYRQLRLSLPALMEALTASRRG